MEDTLKICHSSLIRVRYADTDKMGIMYNGNYFAYMEVGRTELMRSIGLPYIEFEEAGYLLPLIESHVNYIKPGYYDDLLGIDAVLNYEYKPTVRFTYGFFREDEKIATGWTIHSFVNAKTWKPVRPPQMYINAVKNWTDIKKII